MDFVLDNGMIYAGGIGGTWNGNVVDVVTETDMTTVVMQYYADASGLLKSYKVGYKFGSDGKWLGYDILENSDYKPFGLRYVQDEASGTTDPQVERFLPYYNAAEAVMKWFSGIGNLTDTNSEIKKFFGYDYAEVRAYAFSENNITDMESMEQYLSTIFTDKMVAGLMAKCADGDYIPTEGERILPVFLFRDGKVWVNGSAGGLREYSIPEFSMSELTESEAVLACRIYRTTYDQVSGTYVRDGDGELYFYKFVKDGDQWLCDEFPVMW